MATFRDVTDLIGKVIEDFRAGAWASISRDIGQGFRLFGDFLESMFGFKASPGELTEEEFAVRVAKLEEMLSEPCPVRAVGGLDGLRVLAAIREFLESAKRLWKLLNPDPVS